MTKPAYCQYTKTMTDKGWKVYWEITDADGTVLVDGMSNSQKQAYAESAHHYRLLDQGRHITQKRDS